MTEPVEVLSAWRTRAVRLEPVEKAVHQAILRSFARTGGPPPLADLDQVVTGSERSTREVLAALHEGDAIRLTPDQRVVVAYPFSTTPTRHRVRIADDVDAYAMCAIDALGIAAMLGRDTRIDSVDVTTGRPITVATTGGHTTWDPADAVVFVGADADGGPSADCCCDYLNFFTDDAAARTWKAQHLIALIREQFGLPDLPFHMGRLLAAGEPITVASAAARSKQAMTQLGWTPAPS